MPISLQYRVIPGVVKAAFNELHNPEEQIESYVATEARAVAAAKTFDQLYTDRDEFTQTVRESLDEAMNDYGYEIRAVLIDDPRPTPEMISAFNEVLASPRRLEAPQARKRDVEGERGSVRGCLGGRSLLKKK